MKTIVVTCWYFNPIHPGHIECFELSKMLGDELRVIVNNDHQAQLKRWVKSFQDEQFRMKVVSSLKAVDRVILSIDAEITEDGEIPVSKTLDKVFTQIQEIYHGYVNIVFTKWWDRIVWKNIPESPICEKYGVKIIDGLGLKTYHSRDFVIM